MMIYENILQTIGSTPLVSLDQMHENKNVKIFAKIEGVNPGGSIKDRIALKMIEQAENEGVLTKGKTIIEATSGNTGISLSMIAAIKGYKAEIVMSSAVSEERKAMIRSFGAKVTLTDSKKGTDGAILKVKELIAQYPHKYFCTDQFTNKYNKIAHYETTSQEIWRQTNGKIDYFVAAIGTSGTLMGVGKGLKKHNKNIKVVSAEPVQGHYIQGLKNMQEAIVPAIYQKEYLDDIIKIETEEAFSVARKIIKQQGIFVGMSSGAAMLAAIKISQKIEKGNIVTIFPDRGEKYLSTSFFQ